ncbi:HEPN domain-containing protein [Pantoea ananatis]|uniref:HEPN domain-containing protein n=1 Tax=Pantoea ananas TaxID=553 RepID=UPI001B308E1F|nr:hypothetical protein [Pantoea ananatis]
MASLKKEFQRLNFRFDETDLNDIECSFEVDDDSHWNTIKVTTLDSRAHLLHDKRNILVSIVSGTPNSDSYKKTEIVDAWIGGFGMSMGHVTTFRFTLHPKEVITTHRFGRMKEKQSKIITHFINKTPLFSPFIVAEPDTNGNLRQKKLRVYKIKIPNGNSISSDAFFTYQSKQGHFESDLYQVLLTKTRTTKNIDKTLHDDINPQISDILLLMSFLQDEKVHSVHWSIDYGNVIKNHYKSNHLKPQDINSSNYHELIDAHYIEEFFTVALPKFHSSPYKHELKNCINSLTLRKKSVVELTFLSYFQGLESLVLAFKRINKLEKILDEDLFSDLRSALEKTIKQTLPTLKKERGRIKNKLSELNRLSLKESMELFLKENGIESDIIWPIFNIKNKNITGLSSIRNVLIHGDLTPSNQLINIAVAMEHLRVLLVRCVFCLLGWDITQTKVSNSHLLKNHNLFKEDVFKKHTSEIDAYFKSKDNPT